MINAKDFADREVKYAPLQFESIEKDGVFEGYASLFQTLDLARDQVMKGAFRNSLNRRPPLAVKLLYQHDPREPIGIWDTIREDHKGLYVKGRLLRAISRARDVHHLMQRRALDGLSIGFKTVRARRQPQTGVRQLLEIDLFEISIVTFPMHPGARVAAIKADSITNGLPTIRDFERWLTRDAGLTRRQAQRAITRGFRSLLDEPPRHPPRAKQDITHALRTLTKSLTTPRG